MSASESASDDNAAVLSEDMTMTASSNAAQPDPSEADPAVAASSLEDTNIELPGAEADDEILSDNNAQDTGLEDIPESTAEASTPDAGSEPEAVDDSLPTAESTPEPVVAAAEIPEPPVATQPTTAATTTAATTAAVTATAEPTPAVLDPAIAERISIPAGTTTDDEPGTGGEWDLLTSKVTAWWDANDLGEQINNLRQPLRLAGILLGVLLVLKVYSGLLAAIGSIPLAPRLLELVGVYWVVRFTATRMVRSKDRSEVIQGLRQRWNSFAGKN